VSTEFLYFSGLECNIYRKKIITTIINKLTLCLENSIGNNPFKLSSKHHKYCKKTVILQHFYLIVCSFCYKLQYHLRVYDNNNNYNNISYTYLRLIDLVFINNFYSIQVLFILYKTKIILSVIITNGI